MDLPSKRRETRAAAGLANGRWFTDAVDGGSPHRIPTRENASCDCIGAPSNRRGYSLMFEFAHSQKKNKLL